MLRAGMKGRRQSHARGRAREIPALLFALVWLLGYEALPLAHVALHSQLAAHTHGAAHCHGDVCHPDDSADSDEDPVSHGENSLEHRGVAALATDLTIYVA